MFICCNKNLLIREGSETLKLSRGFIGGIDDRWANHWYIKAAIADGSIVTSGENPVRKAPKAGKTAAE